MNDIPIRDIHLPDLPGWWPIATGWWWLLALFIVLLIVVPRIVNKLRTRSLSQLAQHDFSAIQKAYRLDNDKTRLLQDLSVLLRRISMSYLSRRQVAGLTGDSWVHQLDTLTSDTGLARQFGHLLTVDVYQQRPDFDADELLKCCQQWLQALPKNKWQVST